jgi:hypothetical protein
LWSFFGSSTVLSAASHYVSPNALSTGNGSFGNPWRLETALAQPLNLLPGDGFLLRQVMDYFADTLRGTVGTDGQILVSMVGYTFAQAIGASKPPVLCTPALAQI